MKNNFVEIFEAYETYIVFLFLSLIVLVTAAMNANFNAEIESCSGWQLGRVYAGTGCTAGLNGEAYHVEGTANLRNLQFFAGGPQDFSLGYEIATNRLLFPYLGSFLTLFTDTILDAVKSLNVICWIIASITAYHLARFLSKSLMVAVFAGIFVACGIGFAATWMGVKAHLISYTYFIVAIYLLERMKVFNEEFFWQKAISAGLLIGLGAFANGLILPLLIYIGLRLISRFRVRRFSLIALISALPLLSIKLGLLLFGVSVGDRTDTVLFSTLASHLVMIWDHLFYGSSEPVLFIHTTVTDPWQPFYWIKEYVFNMPLMFGVFGFLFAAVGLLPPWGRIHVIAIPSILAVSISVVGVQTYWPYWAFQGYTAYYVYVGFSLIVALGVTRIIGLFSKSIEIYQGECSQFIRNMMFVCISVSWFSLVSHHVVTHHYLSFFTFYNSYSLDFPNNWDFRKMNW